MRYAEKSFEVRFCAALTAAIMPWNRNPLWFGMTQAEERETGVDTALDTGGRLIFFQFKAQQNEKIKIGRDQCQKLCDTPKRYRGNTFTFYVFPEAGNNLAAAKEPCLFRHAWCCPPSKFLSSFRSEGNSASFSLKPKSSQLERQRPPKNIAVQTTCNQFGCFCPPFAYDMIAIEAILSKYRVPSQFLIKDWLRIAPDFVLPPFGISGMGIPLSREPNKSDDDINPITSSEQFERLFGDGADKNWDRGIYGLFIPTSLTSEQEDKR